MAYRKPIALKDKVPCKLCGQPYTPGGPMKAHNKKCLADHQKETENVRLWQKGWLQVPQSDMQYPDSFNMSYNLSDDFVQEGSSTPIHAESLGQLRPMNDEIKVEYHPASQCPTEQKAFNECGKREVKDPELFDFPSWFDYEVADLALHCHMTAGQTTTFLCLLEKAYQDSEVHMQTYDHVQAMWDTAANCSTRFQHTKITVSLTKNVERTYKSYHCLLLDWIGEVVCSEILTEHIQWDTQKHYHFTGQC
ncbi:hypothetical protein AAF712_014193 [Marasmius tenuissimus]|uniref:Uncharacterized protein n=1 Tax=Marasmius tenuissimus TaxID=585030 RepID=A0ABR2ZCZ1_9AGAR